MTLENLNKYVKEKFLTVIFIDMEKAILSFYNSNSQTILTLAEAFIKTAFFINGIMAFAGLLTLAERKVSAIMQDRVGPNRASIFGFSLGGLFHPAADGIKLLTKEDFIPQKADKFFFTIAPMIGLVSVLVCFSFIPFGDTLPVFSRQIRLVISDIDAAVFLLLGFSSMAIYAAFAGGYFSGNNFAVLGAMRAAAQMISYEAVLGLSLIPMLMIYSVSNLSDIVIAQGKTIYGFIPAWGIFFQPLAFIIFLTASIAENKRTPFDVVEGESEIVGYFIEYSSMRFGAFMFAEFIEIIFISMVSVTFFLGGWQLPWLEGNIWHIPFFQPISIPLLVASLLKIASFALKTAIFSIFLLVIRWTLPRMRFDQIMSLCWKFLLPLALVNIALTAIFLRFSM